MRVDGNDNQMAVKKNSSTTQLTVRKNDGTKETLAEDRRAKRSYPEFCAASTYANHMFLNDFRGPDPEHVLGDIHEVLSQLISIWKLLIMAMGVIIMRKIRGYDEIGL